MDPFQCHVFMGRYVLPAWGPDCSLNGEDLGVVFRMMELRQLRNFLVVAQTLNISKAARRLHVTQPALSRQIQDLEAEVGSVLFLREPGRLRLTAAGAALRTHGAKGVAVMDDALRRARSVTAPAATGLRIGYYGVSWAVLVEPALKRLRREYAGLTLTLTDHPPAQLAAGLRRGNLDVVLLNRDFKAPNVLTNQVARVPMLVALPVDHALARKRLIDLADLRSEKIISFARHVGFGRDRPFVAACRTAGFAPKIRYGPVTLSELMLSVATHHGIALITILAQGAPHPGVVLRKLATPVCLDIYAAYSRTAPPAARRLAELMADEGHRLTAQK